MTCAGTVFPILVTPPYSINDHVDDLAGLLDYLEVKSAVICGLSVGGLVAQGLYAARPDLVRALILCDTAHKIGTAETWAARIAAVRKDGIASIADSIFKLWFTPAFHAQRREELAGYRNMLVRQPTDGYTGTCAALSGADFTRQLPGASQFRRSALSATRMARPRRTLCFQLAKLIPRSRYEVIKDAAHIPCVEQPEALTAVMRAFIDEFQLGEKS